MKKQPLTSLRGFRLEIDRVDRLLILVPFSDPNAPPLHQTPEQLEKSHQVMRQLMALANAGDVIFVHQTPDGTFEPEFRADMKEKIRTRNISLRDFAPIPIYAPDGWLPSGDVDM